METGSLDECFKPLKGHISAKGYYHIYKNGKYLRAHRQAYEDAFGEIPEGMCVCHKCDNRWCVNPLHLWLGTNGDNVRDRVLKSRSAMGERVGNSKLNPEIIVEARRLRNDGMTYRSLAKKFNITHGAVRRAVIGITWKHLNV